MNMRMIRTILFTLLLISSSVVSAGNAKILKLTPLRYKVGLDGLELIVSVKYKLNNVTSEDCGCVIFLNDKRQPVTTLQEMGALYEQVYYGEEMIDRAHDSLLVSIPVDMDFLKNISKAYLQAFILDAEEGEVLDASAVIDFSTRDNRLMTNMENNLERDLNKSVMNTLINGVIGSLLGGGSSSRPKGTIHCDSCGGSGACNSCVGMSYDEKKECSSCNGTGRCRACDGNGYY